MASNGDVGMKTEGEITPVNIICIMNESLADLKTAGDFETNREYFPFLNSLGRRTRSVGAFAAGVRLHDQQYGI